MEIIEAKMVGISDLNVKEQLANEIEALPADIIQQASVNLKQNNGLQGASFYDLQIAAVQALVETLRTPIDSINNQESE